MATNLVDHYTTIPLDLLSGMTSQQPAQSSRRVDAYVLLRAVAPLCLVLICWMGIQRVEAQPTVGVWERVSPYFSVLHWLDLESGDVITHPDTLKPVMSSRPALTAGPYASPYAIGSHTTMHISQQGEPMHS